MYKHDDSFDSLLSDINSKIEPVQSQTINNNLKQSSSKPVSVKTQEKVEVQKAATKTDTVHEIVDKTQENSSSSNEPSVQQIINKVNDDVVKSASDEHNNPNQIVDESFRDFFTQSVTVTKTPEDLDIPVKRKKINFFKKKFVTDSLALSVPAQEASDTSADKLHQPAKPNLHYKPVDKAIGVTPVDEPSTAVHSTTKAKTEQQPPVQPNTNFDDGSMADTIYKAVISKSEPTTNEPVNDMTGVFIPLDQIPTKSKTDEPLEEVKTKQPFFTDDIQLEEPLVFEEYLIQTEANDKFDLESEDIADELKGFEFTLNLRIGIGLFCSAVLFYFNASPSTMLPLPEFMSPHAQPLLYYMITLLVYLISLIAFTPTIASGFKSFFSTPAPDSLISMASVMCALQLIFLCIFSDKYAPSTTTIFAGFLCFALAFNAIGKKLSTKSILKNLSLANVPAGINAGCIITDTDAVRRLARTLDEKTPQILVSRKTDSITNFVKAGFTVRKSDYTAKKLAIATTIVTFVCFIMALIISNDFGTAIFCATGAAVLQIPLSHTLIGSLPFTLMQKSLEKVGALVNGWQGVDELSKTTHLTFDVKHLFPAGSVTLHGIKTFQKDRLDLAILYAASVLIEKCETLRPIFMAVIENKTDMLYPIESCEYTEGQGYVAWIENTRVLIGNRALMSNYIVDLPPISLENNFIAQNKKPIYLAVNGKLFGMFIVSYAAQDDIKENLQDLVDGGVNIILTSNDFNVDSTLIERTFNIPSDFVQVLNKNSSSLLSNYNSEVPSCEASMAHLDSIHSLIAGFFSADAAKWAENTCSLVQCMSVLIGAVLALIFTYSQTISTLPLQSILALSIGWAGLSLLGAFIKKY